MFLFQDFYNPVYKVSCQILSSVAGWCDPMATKYERQINDATLITYLEMIFESVNIILSFL